MSMWALALYRFISELACLAGVIVAGWLAYADKSPWIWSWFLVFACLNIVSGGRVSATTFDKTSEANRS